MYNINTIYLIVFGGNMEIGQSIYKIRNNAKLTQDQFAEIFDVSIDELIK